MQTFGAVQGFTIRGDLRQKHGIAPIQTWDDLYKFWDVIAANEPGISPVNGNGFLNQTQWAGQFPGMGNNPDTLFHQVSIGTGAFGVLQMAPDRRSVVDMFVGSDPRIVNGHWFNQQQAILHTEWLENNWLPANYGTMPNPERNNSFINGTAASQPGAVGTIGARTADLARNIPGASLEFFVSNDGVRDFQPRALASGFMADNFKAIPVTSRHQERAMMFFSWLFENEENNNLFTHGIEGVHWNKIGDDRFELPAGAPVFGLAGQAFLLSWNTNYTRQNVTLPDIVFEYFRYTTNPDNFFQGPFAGFSSNPANYVNSLPLIASATQATALQIVQNPTISVARKREMLDTVWNTEVVPAGIEAITADVIRQATEWLQR
jgi:putative aldouronate transport system substrate-binding protein